MAAGAVGPHLQKLGEAEIFVDAGVCDDYPPHLQHHRREEDRPADGAVPAGSSVSPWSPTTIPSCRGLSEAGLRHGRDVHLLIECDTGFGRNGVQSPEAALDLARYALETAAHRFRGTRWSFPTPRRGRSSSSGAPLRCSPKAGIPLPVLSGGGTPALAHLADYPMMTEHRAGTYVYNDVMMVHSGSPAGKTAPCMSGRRSSAGPTADRAIIDSGSKVLTSDQYYVEHYGRLVEYPEAFVSALSEEHAIVDLSRSPARPKVGDVVSIIPNHCCPVSNLAEEVYGVRNGGVEVVWPVAARGKVR